MEGASSRRPAKLRAARLYLALPNLKPLLGASPLGASPAPPNLNPLLGASPADTESQCGWHYQYARALGGKVRQAHGTAPSPRCHSAGVAPPGAEVGVGPNHTAHAANERGHTGGGSHRSTGRCTRQVPVFVWCTCWFAAKREARRCGRAARVAKLESRGRRRGAGATEFEARRCCGCGCGCRCARRREGVCVCISFSEARRRCVEPGVERPVRAEGVVCSGTAPEQRRSGRQSRLQTGSGSHSLRCMRSRPRIGSDLGSR